MFADNADWYCQGYHWGLGMQSLQNLNNVQKKCLQVRVSVLPRSTIEKKKKKADVNLLTARISTGSWEEYDILQDTCTVAAF